MSQTLRLQPSAAVKEKRLADVARGAWPSTGRPGAGGDRRGRAAARQPRARGSPRDLGRGALLARRGRRPGGGPRAAPRPRRGAGRCAVQPRGDPSVARGARGAGGLPPRRAGEGRRAPRAGGVRPEPSRDPRGVAGGSRLPRPEARAGGGGRPRADRRDRSLRRRQRPRLAPRRLAPHGARRPAPADPGGRRRRPPPRGARVRRSAWRPSRSFSCWSRPPAAPST